MCQIPGIEKPPQAVPERVWGAAIYIERADAPEVGFSTIESWSANCSIVVPTSSLPARSTVSFPLV